MAKAPEITAVATELYKLLKPLESDMRSRAINAALMLLGDGEVNRDGGTGGKGRRREEDGGDTDDFGPKVKGWMTSNGVSKEQLDRVFHIDGGTVDILANDVPGKTGKAKTINSYVLTGVGQFVRSSEPKFDDKQGREACVKMGCYQRTNHTSFIKSAASLLSGGKTKGWIVTGPGLKAGAELVKEMAPSGG